MRESSIYTGEKNGCEKNIEKSKKTLRKGLDKGRRK